MMQFQVPIHIEPLQPPITYGSRLLLTGSCFTEHIGNHLLEHKFRVLQNPNGILFDPVSVCQALVSYIKPVQYTEEDLFSLHEGWHSWLHHSRYSDPSPAASVNRINGSQQQAHQFLQQSDWLIITLGSAFTYRFSEALPAELRKGPAAQAANCHKAPAQYFRKHLLTIEEIITALDGTVHQLFHFNPRLRIMFTISPVRHIRDGVVENNRSKARLIEAVHHLVNKFDRLYYFPAYELVIDVLRDYRFYDIDLVHPNYAATSFVLEKFTEYCLDEESRQVKEEVRRLVTARRHKPFNAHSELHRQFLRSHLEKAQRLQQLYPFLDLSEEIGYFEGRG